jgi:hypothetical protein
MKSDLDAIRIEDLRKNKKEREDDLISIRDKTCIFNSNHNGTSPASLEVGGES